jgi:secreted PhoX family phosphatase
MNDRHHRHFSRRAVLKGAALLAAVTATTGTTAARAQAKATKAAMQYRNTPNGKQECSNCLQFIPGKTPKAEGACKVVDGPISPHGWCIAYAPKS